MNQPVRQVTVSDFDRIVSSILEKYGVTKVSDLPADKQEAVKKEIQKAIGRQSKDYQKFLKGEFLKSFDQRQRALSKDALNSTKATLERLLKQTPNVAKEAAKNADKAAKEAAKGVSLLGNLTKFLAKLPFAKEIVAGFNSVIKFIAPIRVFATGFASSPFAKVILKFIPFVNLVSNAVLLWQLYQMISNASKVLGNTETIKKIVQSPSYGLSVLKSIIDRTGTEVKNLSTNIIPKLNQNIATVQKNVEQVARNVGLTVTAVQSVGRDVKGLNGTIGGTVQSTGKSIIAEIQKLGAKVQPVDYNRITQAVKGAVPAIDYNRITQGVKAAVPPVDYNRITSAVNASTSTITSRLAALPSVTQIAQGVVNGVRPLISPVDSKVTQVQSSINGLNTTINSLNSNLSQVNSKLTTLQTTLTTINNKLPSGVATASDINSLRTAIGSVQSVAQGLVGQLNGVQSNLTTTINTAATSVVNQVTTNTTNIVNNNTAQVDLTPVMGAINQQILPALNLIQQFNSDMGTVFQIQQLKNGLTINPEQAITNAIPQAYGSTTNQSMQVNNLTGLLAALVVPLFARAGFHRLPATVPTKVGEPGTTTIYDALTFSNWQFSQLDDRLGLPSTINRRNADGTTTAVKHRSLHDSIEHVFAVSSGNAADIETVEQIMMRVAGEVIKLEQIALRTAYDVDAIIDYMSFPYSEKKTSHPVNYRIGANNMREFLQDTNLHVSTRQFTGKTDLQQILQKIHYEAGKSAVSYFERVDDINAIKTPDQKMSPVNREDEERWKRFVYEVNNTNSQLKQPGDVQPRIEVMENGNVKPEGLPTDPSKPLT